MSVREDGRWVTMSAISYNALGGGAARSGQPTPGRFPRMDNGSRGRTGTGKGNGKPLTAAEIMRGKAPVVASPAKDQDDYPGLDVILKTARKMKPFLSTDVEQARRALDSLLPLGIFPRMRELYHERLEEDLIKAVAKWRADNWFLPVDKEAEFPYARTRNLVDPMVKYGNLWLRKDYDSGFSYDGEGDSLDWHEYIENIDRANAIEMSDLFLKGMESGVKVPDAVLEKMKAENKELKKSFENTEFDRYEEVMRCYTMPGYLISGRFRAYRIYAKEQSKLLQAYDAAPSPSTKKDLLQHVYKHGQLVPKVPEEDSYVKAPAKGKAAGAVQAPAKVQLGAVTDSVEV